MSKYFVRHMWFYPEDETPKAVVVVVHGLNLNPSRMDEISTWLEKKGCLVLRIALTGHGPDEQEFTEISREKWQKDIIEAYEMAQKEALIHHIPLYFIGYSLGGLMGTDVLSSYPTVRFDKMVLLAPAIVLRNYTSVMKAVLLLKDDFVAYSFSPEKYRAHAGTPVSAYRALFGTADALATATDMSLANIPTLVFIHPRDEMVSHTGLQNFIKQKSLDLWQLIFLGHLKAEKGITYCHLIVNRESVGEQLWKEMTEKMATFLQLN